MRRWIQKDPTGGDLGWRAQRGPETMPPPILVFPDIPPATSVKAALPSLQRKVTFMIINLVSAQSFLWTEVFVYDIQNDPPPPIVNSLIVSIIPFVWMAAPHPLLGVSSWICCEGLSVKTPLVGWDTARGKIFVKLQSACVQHIQLKAKSHCENMQLDMQSKRIFNVFLPRFRFSMQCTVERSSAPSRWTGPPHVSSMDH